MEHESRNLKPEGGEELVKKSCSTPVNNRGTNSSSTIASISQLTHPHTPHLLCQANNFISPVHFFRYQTGKSETEAGQDKARIVVETDTTAAGVDIERGTALKEKKVKTRWCVCSCVP